MLKLFATTAAVALLTFGGPSLAQTAPSTQRPAAGTAMPSGTQAKQEVDRGDRKFMLNAAHDNAKEIALGKMAQQKAQHPLVKQLAETIVKDHTEAGEKLEPIAASMGVDLSEAIAEGQKEDADDFQKLSGVEFDRQYVEEMIDDHEDDVEEFEEAAQNAKNPELKAWAAEVAPKLRNHLQLAKAADNALGQATTSGTGMGGAASGSSSAPSAPASGGSTTK